MLVYVKSVPDAVDNVVHVIASLPVTVNVIDADVEVAADAANVTVGAVVSTRCEALAVIAEWVSVALLFAASLIVPLLSSSVFAVIANPSASVSPASTVYENTSVAVPDPDA
jgi:hypothetical protein